MEKPGDKELDDEAVHFLQKALYVEPLPYTIDLEQVPSNGHEYIHQVRLEQMKYFPEETKSIFNCYPGDTPDEQKNGDVDKLTLAQWKRKEARAFSDLALDIKQRRIELMVKFPAQDMPPIGNEKNCCLFCLGSELYAKIYNGENITHTEGIYPYMSIVLHLKQEEIIELLTYMTTWINVVGMNHMLCRWLYSLLACVQKPLPHQYEKFLETFYDDLVRRIRNCNESEKKQLHLISAILYNYFCVKAYKVGPKLDQFVKLI